jgi:hypothetical protein
MVSIFSSGGDYLRAVGIDYLSLAYPEPQYPPFDRAAHLAELDRQHARRISDGNLYLADVVAIVSGAGAVLADVVVKDGEDGVPFLRAHLRFANGYAVEVGYNEITRVMYSTDMVTFHVYAVTGETGHPLSDDHGYYESGMIRVHGWPIEDTRHSRYLDVCTLKDALADVAGAPDYHTIEDRS